MKLPPNNLGPIRSDKATMLTQPVFMSFALFGLV